MKIQMQKSQIHVSVDFPQLTFGRWQVSAKLMDAPSGSNRKAHNPDLTDMGRVHSPVFCNIKSQFHVPPLSNKSTICADFHSSESRRQQLSSFCDKMNTWYKCMGRFFVDHMVHETQTCHQNPCNAVFVSDFVDRIGFHGSKIHQTACNAAFVGDFVGGIDIWDSKIEREFPRGILCSKKLLGKWMIFCSHKIDVVIPTIILAI